MKSLSFLLALAFVAGAFGLSPSPAQADEGLVKVAARVSNYCHMRFPAIREETLGWDRPVLQGKGTRDMIDYYGSCNHDPLGKDEIFRQMRTVAERQTDQ